VKVVADAEAVAQLAAETVAAAIRDGTRSLVLTGGTTPRRMYGLLAGMELAWGRVSLLFGDERCVPPGDIESNYRLVKETLLTGIDAGAVLRIPGELGAEEAASIYDALVGRMQPLDLVLLGIGEDGHCASLFPGHPALAAEGWAVPVHNAPKPPPDRVSLSLGCLRNARRVIFMVTGAGKADAFRKAQAGAVPAGMIAGAEWIVDREAAA
jgi:6-phosphogluconolactonase